MIIGPKSNSPPPKNLETDNIKRGKRRRQKFLPVDHIKRSF